MAREWYGCIFADEFRELYDMATTQPFKACKQPFSKIGPLRLVVCLTCQARCGCRDPAGFIEAHRLGHECQKNGAHITSFHPYIMTPEQYDRYSRVDFRNKFVWDGQRYVARAGLSLGTEVEIIRRSIWPLKGDKPEPRLALSLPMDRWNERQTLIGMRPTAPSSLPALLRQHVYQPPEGSIQRRALLDSGYGSSEGITRGMRKLATSRSELQSGQQHLQQGGAYMNAFTSGVGSKFSDDSILNSATAIESMNTGYPQDLDDEQIMEDEPVNNDLIDNGPESYTDAEWHYLFRTFTHLVDLAENQDAEPFV
ncbi:predicted protein [Verticillium alfalfae VaMs.102]|uniref:Predicted protein n=1 Tax=Verticillium alfalfae (strain VaMs.102 / ATCC MYA-4576 / FGSC 10136) TaxID=526221 RepID=C9SU37_VERA1|nr:predicted protein [Verticillium alfalfae VaMs.102]EEY22348.1 predicted protein [Verticillium alfalfae VaMs.102]